MARTTLSIRLVGGPRPLDASRYDLSLDDLDRADAGGDRFLRAVRGTTVTSLSGLQAQCLDRARAEALAAEWRVAVFTAGRDRRARARIYRYQGTFPLTAHRDDLGRWTLALPDGPNADPGAGDPASVWALLEREVDEAARRFTAVAGLLPDGPLAERAETSQRAVATCVSDAARLCAVGATVAPVWHPTLTADQGRDLADRVSALIGTIDTATDHLVELHLAVADPVDPVEPVAHLRAAWRELES